MRLPKNIALLCTILMITCIFTPITIHASPDSPEEIVDEEPKWWDEWNRDKNHDKIDDLIEAVDPEERIDIFINYDYHPTEGDVERLSKFDMDVKYVYNYIDVICARKVAVPDLDAISSLPHVVMVKLEPKIYPLLDVSAKAIKARESEQYSPYTAFELGVDGGTNQEISIAILDTGVDDAGYSPNQRHESLDDMDDDPTTTNDPKFEAGVDFTQEETFLVPRDGTYNPDDTNGHGTHCAGIAMGTGGTNKQYVGIAPGAKLVDIKVMESWGTGNMGDTIAGIEWCVAHESQYNIRVLSLSLGGIFGESNGDDEVSQAVNNAADAGIVVVAAMGNDGEKRVTSPAAADGAIAVGSVDDVDTIERNDDTLSSFSNTGPRQDDGDDDKLDELKPDVVAYGDGIMSAQANTQATYATKSGTSMSTPHVAGVVALMLDANSNLTPDMIKMILREAAEPRGTPSYPNLDPKYNTDYGWGIVDAYKAVNMALGYREVNVNIDRPTNGDTVKGIVDISGTSYVNPGTVSVSLVEVSIDDPNFQSVTFTAEGTSIWSVSWDTEGWDGARTIYARAISGNYTAYSYVDVVVDNGKSSGGGDGLTDGDDEQIIVIAGLRIKLIALIAIVGIVVVVIVLIVAAILLKRRSMYKRMIAERQTLREER